MRTPFKKPVKTAPTPADTTLTSEHTRINTALTLPHTDPSYRIRLATTQDIPTMKQMSDDILDAGFLWNRYIGDAHNETTPLALVAQTPDNRIIALLGIRPIDPRNEINHTPQKSTFTSAIIPWMKLSALAVVSEHRGRGIAHDLLQRAMTALPPSIVGIYGNVDDHRTTSIQWYRRQGFYLHPTVFMPAKGGSSHPGVWFRCDPGASFFRGERDTVTAHLAGHGDPQHEERAAELEYRRHLKATPRRRQDPGYFALAHKLAKKHGKPACPHIEMGPRPTWIFGWDPNHQPVCMHCVQNHAARIQIHDAMDRCDGCHREQRQDIDVSEVALDEHRLTIAAGLCAPCRAGNIPDRARPTKGASFGL